MTKQQHRCGRCGDTFAKLATKGPHANLLCEICALTDDHEQQTEARLIADPISQVLLADKDYARRVLGTESDA